MLGGTHKHADLRFPHPPHEVLTHLCWRRVRVRAFTGFCALRMLRGSHLCCGHGCGCNIRSSWCTCVQAAMDLVRVVQQMRPWRERLAGCRGCLLLMGQVGVTRIQVVRVTLVFWVSVCLLLYLRLCINFRFSLTRWPCPLWLRHPHLRCAQLGLT